MDAHALGVHADAMTDETSPVAVRLKELRARAGLSIREVADRLGLATGSGYQHYEAKFKKPYLPLDFVERLAPIFAERGVPPAEIYALAGVSKGPAAEPPRKATPPGPGVAEGGAAMAAIEELDVRAAAGDGSLHEIETVAATWRMPLEMLAAQTTAGPTALKVIRVYGDSMAPEFLPGERVLVDTSDRTPSPPGVFVLWDGFGLVLKRVELIPYSDPPTLRLTSANAHYGAYERPLAEVHVNGRVIGKWLWT